MRFSAPLSFLLILVIGVSWAQAWYIDDSCRNPIKSAKPCSDSDDSDYSSDSDVEMDEGDTNDAPVEHLNIDMTPDLNKIILSAFGLMQNGVDALGKLKVGQNNDAQMDILEFMYASAVHTDDHQKRTVNHDNDHFDIITSIFDQSMSFKDHNSGYQKGDVGFFCDYSRYDENKDQHGKTKPGWAWDRKLKKLVEMDELWEICRDDTGTDTSDEDLLYFAVPHAGEDGEDPHIQMCQGFFQRIKKAKYQIWADIAKDLETVLPKIEMDQVLEDVPITNMDKASRFDQDVAHELTHVIKKHATDDIREEYSYGWLNAISISEQTKQDPVTYFKPSYKNADSAAFAALGFTMINPGESLQAHRPLKNGEIVRL